MNRPPPAGESAAATEAFLAHVQRLTARQWQSVMGRSRSLGDNLAREDVIRGAVVSITVRVFLPRQHFELLYMPFAEVIPFASLPASDAAPG